MSGRVGPVLVGAGGVAVAVLLGWGGQVLVAEPVGHPELPGDRIVRQEGAAQPFRYHVWRNGACRAAEAPVIRQLVVDETGSSTEVARVAMDAAEAAIGPVDPGASPAPPPGVTC